MGAINRLRELDPKRLKQKNYIQNAIIDFNIKEKEVKVDQLN